MAIDKIQLKQETVVDNDVVLEDINPKTSTLSVTDSSTGFSLEETLDRIWNEINSKLSRVVNSVNGRTGVVVLRPEDVGLGNVDNVSFEDIKKWVINRMTVEFGNKRLKLFDSLHELDSLISINDHIYRDTPFFSTHGYGGDRKSYIGYIYLDEGTGELKYKSKAIKTVGYTDNSIIYDESVNGTDLTGGGLGVNIWKYETALQLYNHVSDNKSESGLMIDHTKIVPKLYWFDGVYGDGTEEDPNAFLALNNIENIETFPIVKIFINENQLLEEFRLKKIDLHEGDLIICNFKDYIVEDTGLHVLLEGASGSLMFRNPAIGRVMSAPAITNKNKEFIVKFYTIKPNVDFGLAYDKYQHSEDTAKDGPLGIKVLEGKPNDRDYHFNISGLQAQSEKSYKHIEDIPVVLPQGLSQLKNYNGGLYVNTDTSLSVIPTKGYGQREYGSGSDMVQNWAVDFPMFEIYPFSLTDTSLLSVNLNKAVKYIDIDKQYKFANLSGLRIDKGKKFDYKNDNFINLNKIDYTGDIDFDDLSMSGGLSVNVGKFLEIEPASYPQNSHDYYDGGKINVKIGKGLTDLGDNKISVNYGRGLTINNDDEDTDNVGKLEVNIPYSKILKHYTSGICFFPTIDNEHSLSLMLPGRCMYTEGSTGIRSDQGSINVFASDTVDQYSSLDSEFVKNRQGLIFVYKKKLLTIIDSETETNEDHKYVYDPLGGAETCNTVNDTIQLGPGLKLVIEEDNSGNTESGNGGTDTPVTEPEETTPTENNNTEVDQS